MTKKVLTDRRTDRQSDYYRATASLRSGDLTIIQLVTGHSRPDSEFRPAVEHHAMGK